MDRKIIKSARLLTLDGRRILRRADILIEKGSIAAIGGGGGIPETSDALIADASGVLLPGLVQAHAHFDQTLLDRRFVADADPWRFREVQLAWWHDALDSDARRLQAMAAFHRSLRAGVTSFADASRGVAASAAIGAARRLGIRLLVGIDTSRLDASRALDALAGELAGEDRELRPHPVLFAGDAERAPLPLLKAASSLSTARGIPLVVHLGMMPGDKDGLRRLERAGALHRHLVVCHATGGAIGSKADARALAGAGASVVLTPAFDLLMGAPSPPLDWLLDAGVNLALGSDTGATRTGLDLFREMRLLAGLLKGRVEAPASTALEIATRGGARALGLGAGVVQVGQPADLIALDLGPDTGDDHETTAEQIIRSGSPDIVRTVWVGGTVAMKLGRVIGGPAPSAGEEEAVRDRIGAAIERAGSIGALAREALAAGRAWLGRDPAWHRGRLALPSKES